MAQTGGSMKEKYLTVSELAKLRNTSSDTLRYYDRINLLKPECVDADTGYRYYSIRQYEKLGTIRELRALGMPLEQIADYFDNRNLQKSMEILSEYQMRFEQEIQQKIRVNEVLKEKLKFLNEVAELKNMEEVFLQEYPRRYMLTFGEPSGGKEAHAYAYTKLEWYLKEVAPILATDRVGVFASEQILEKNESFIPAIPMIIVENVGKSGKYIREIPAGTYACMYYKNGTLEKYDKSFEIIKKYIKEHNFEICGNIFQIYKIDVTLTNNREETVMEIQIPVGKQE